MEETSGSLGPRNSSTYTSLFWVPWTVGLPLANIKGTPKLIMSDSESYLAKKNGGDPSTLYIASQTNGRIRHPKQRSARAHASAQRRQRSLMPVAPMRLGGIPLIQTRSRLEHRKGLETNNPSMSFTLTWFPLQRT